MKRIKDALRRMTVAAAIGATALSAVTPAHAATRTCRAEVQFVHIDGGVQVLGSFNVEGSSRRPDNARRQARDRALRCLRVHHELRAQAATPGECTSAYGVQQYPFTSESLATTMDRNFCATRPGQANQQATFRIVVTGRQGCNATEVLSVWPIDCTNS